MSSASACYAPSNNNNNIYYQSVDDGHAFKLVHANDAILHCKNNTATAVNTSTTSLNKCDSSNRYNKITIII